MTFDDTRDNTTAIESNLTAADAYEDTREVDGVVRSKPFMDDYLPEQDDPEHDPIGDADTEYDIEYDDGQPSEYDEWQDYMGGDDWDHGQYDDCGW